MSNNLLPPSPVDKLVGYFLVLIIVLSFIAAKLIDIGIVKW